MKILAKTGIEGIAAVYVAETNDGKPIEFAESVQPPLPREEKWVLTLSTLYGCPIGCKFCDAGSRYQGRLSTKDLFSQVDYLISRHFENGKIPVRKFKIQLARMGEPALNPNVLEFLEALPARYDAPGLLPSFSTIAPDGTEEFFNRLLLIKRNIYRENFQLQFSIHTTDRKKRDWLVPTKKWDFERLAEYGGEFFHGGGKKITLNFALADGMPIHPEALLRYFSPTKFLVKITPVNPTFQARRNGLTSPAGSNRNDLEIVERLQEAGYEVLLSIGELTENDIGSNCGQHITNFLRAGTSIPDAYTVPLTSVRDREAAAIC